MDKEQNAPEPEAIQRFRGRSWFSGWWGVLLLLFVGLLGACAYWIARRVQGYEVGQEFGWAAMLACILGILLLGRWAIPDLLLNASKTDPRSAHLARSWWMRGWFLVRNRRD